MNSHLQKFDHYSLFPLDEWRWPNFSPLEMACRGSGALMVDFDAMDCLQALRDDLGKPIYLNSAYRSPEHNRRVGGAEQSQHLRARAYDINLRNHDPRQLEAAAQKAGFSSFGTYPKQNFLHIDTREQPARWGEPFPAAPPQEAQATRQPKASRPSLPRSRRDRWGRIRSR
ncbi:D-Ala-D-Ala carboxypeptidase family metallohydrolase [Pseudophaeobacter flagellatus]|uniref:D-Ala-D-Ala carboxypeptidase family metallohydrolase n=1 Tax=Pseudophaeobacter flagellatus TaxID=2899119 RepID=UPI001E63FB38|nr:D-Ala-D-Ala carboxypeptidase family metallohydrolase [Pseudophaeobacter flagellatus]MCD9147861.1 D-Ala-D-Ala carboxypeptidase family metallohydrolase [Pseudophaeobacter flagellatus]